MPPNKEKLKQAAIKRRATELDKYGSEEAYRAEMKRRRAMVKKPGYASMDVEKHLAASRKGGLRRWAKRDADKDSADGRAPADTAG